MLGNKSIIVDEARNPEIQSNLLLACQKYENINSSTRQNLMECLLSLIDKYSHSKDNDHSLKLARGCLDMSNHIVDYLVTNFDQ